MLVEQNLTQLLLLQPATCTLKAFFTHSKWKELRSSAQIFNLSWNGTREWIYDCRFCNFVKKKIKQKKPSFFKKRENFLPQQIFSNLPRRLRRHFPYAGANCKDWTIVDTIYCLMPSKALNFGISSTSAGDGGFRNSVSLLDTTVPMFSNFSVIDSTFIWTIAPNDSLCKHIDWK